MKVSIVIPNYNGEDLLKKNLPTIVKRSKNCEIIIVDDASTDNSIEYIKNAFPQICIIKRHENSGFAQSVNEGVKMATGELVILLNTDIYPKENYIDGLLPHFGNPLTFAVGCLQESHEDQKVILRGRGIGNFRKGFLIHARGDVNKKDTLWVSGGASMYRKSIWQKLGGMTPLYSPFYWEDIDLSYRALKSGFQIYFEPKSRVIHDQTMSSIRIKHDKNFITTIAYRNQILFVWLNINDLQLLAEHFLLLPKYIIKSLISRDFQFLNGFFQALSNIKQVFQLRNMHSPQWIIEDKEVLERFHS